MTALIGLGALLVTAFVAWRFFFFLRDPVRYPPPGDSVLAPADGFVTYVQRVTAGQVPIAIKGSRSIPLTEYSAIEGLRESDGLLIGTFMTAFSVHRNRIPVSGTVIFKRHRPAPRNRTTARLFSNVLLDRRPYEEGCEFRATNERLSIAIRTAAGVVIVTQIADAWIDRILARVEVGDEVRRGEPYGLIRFGSQVDLFLPDSLGIEVVVKPGQYVRAGETPIAVRSVRSEGVRFRMLQPEEEAEAKAIAERAFEGHRFYTAVTGFNRTRFRAYWDAFFRMTLEDPSARVYGLDVDGEIVGVLLLGLEGFPRPRHAIRFLGTLLGRVGLGSWLWYLRFALGYVRLMARPAGEQKAEAQGLWLAVRPDLWGRGLGSKIVQAFLGALRQEGKTLFTAFVDGTDARLIEFYRRLGGIVTGRRLFAGGPAVRMERREGNHSRSF